MYRIQVPVREVVALQVLRAGELWVHRAEEVRESGPRSAGELGLLVEPVVVGDLVERVTEIHENMSTVQNMNFLTSTFCEP